MTDALKEKLKACQSRVESGIDRYLPPAETRPERLHQAMRYSMEAGGKRIRPALLFLASELFPAKSDPLAAAVAIESLHTYTLIHDDLPAIDDSDLRRGRPACHAKFDESTAILAGDALLTFAFQLLSSAYRDHPDLAVTLIHDLADAAGSERLIGGQQEDIDNEGQAVDAATLRYIHENKTAALLTAALTMGLRFSGPDEGRLTQIRSVGYHLGMTFQILDDILDATSTPETMGKPVGNDATAEKSTYVALHGLEGARVEASRHTELAVDTARELGGENALLLQFIQSLQERAK